MAQAAMAVRTAREAMTPNPFTMPASSSVVDAARRMSTSNIGDVIVTEGDRICGILTDRDIVVRAVAKGSNLSKTVLKDVCSRKLVTASPSDDLEQVTKLMRDKAVRRVPVVESGHAIGIISLGDVAVKSHDGSVLEAISEAPPTH